jgi:Ca-activated chloride channel family protein
VVYAGAAGMVLEPTPVKNKTQILNAITQLQAKGSTAGGAGIQMAYQLAQQNFDKQAVNRVILGTDGDFNVGITDGNELKGFVERQRKQGIYLSVLGFGQGNYNDHLMQQLAQNGNGIAAYIDTLSEAQKILIHEASANLFPIADDLKVQVEFNPATVQEYRLIGYETRALNKEDFNNDRVDAGDIGSGHSVTAIYEFTPTGGNALIDKPRYAANQQAAFHADAVTGEYAFIKLRYKLPGEKQSRLLSQPVDAENSTLSNLHQREVNFALSVTGFAQLLKESKYIGQWDMDDVIELAQANKGDDPYGYRTEFIQLARKSKIAKSM